MSNLISTYASSGNANPHVVPLSGKTNGRDVFVLFLVGATPTLPSPWVEEASLLIGIGAAYGKLWRLPAAANTSSVTSLSIALNAARSLSAVVWEDDVSTTTLYAHLFDQAATGSTPALWGTNLHTFPTRDETFALFCGIANDNVNPITLDLTAFDHSYTDFADSGSSTGTGPIRVWVAKKQNAAMANDGVTATANVSATAGNLGSIGLVGMIAYESLGPPAAPSNTTAPVMTGTPVVGNVLTCTAGVWSGNPDPVLTYQWTRDGAAISGATAATYTVQTADASTPHKVGCTVTATNSNGSLSVASNTTWPSPATPAKLTIAQENSLPGNPSTQWGISGAGDLTNVGFARPFSLDVGNTVNFACHGSGTVIGIYRLGWYGGDGARRIATVTNTPTTQPAPTTISSSNGATSCSNWSNSASWAVPSTATPGLYFALFQNAALSGASWIPFVVRDDSRSADIMVKTSDSTWALAYNYFGTIASPLTGNSLYGTGPVGVTGGITSRCHAATYEKPIITREGIPQTYWLDAEAPLIRFLERNGLDVTYSASRDWREGGDAPTPAACGIYISSGHDEYWSQGMRDKWEALRDAGKHVLFMSGNFLWRTRFDTGGNVMWCFKDTMDGPGAHVGGVALDPVTWTGSWKDIRWSGRERPNLLTGTDWGLNGLNYVALSMPDTAVELDHTFWRDTNVSTAGLSVGGGIIGFEADEVLPNQPDASTTYLARQMFAVSGAYTDVNGQTYGVDNPEFDWRLVCQRYHSGALVVGFGSCQWSWGLDNAHDRMLIDITHPALRQSMLNLLVDLGSAPPLTVMSGLTVPTPGALNDYGVVPAVDGRPADPDTFPLVTTSLDNFNRANGFVMAGAGAAIWTTTAVNSSLAAMVVAGNQMARGVTSPGCLSVASIGPDFDLQFSLPVLPTSGNYVALWWNIVNPGTDIYDATALVLFAGTPARWELRRYYHGGAAVSGGSAHVVDAGFSSLVAGDKVGIRQRGSTITFFRHDGTSWAQVFSLYDVRLKPVASPIGFELGDTTVRVDDLSGGSLPTERTTPVRKFSLAGGGDPYARTRHKIVIRARVTTAISAVLHAALYEGSTNRSGDLTSASLTTSLADYELPISDAAAASITSYADLAIWVWATSPTGTGTLEIAEVYLSTPTAPVPLTLAPSNAGASGTLALKAPASLALNASSAVATGTALVTAPQLLALSSAASASGSLLLIGLPKLVLAGSATATGSLSLLLGANLTLSGSAQAAGTLSLFVPAPTPGTLPLVPSTATASGLFTPRVVVRLGLSATAHASGALVVISSSVIATHKRLHLEVIERGLSLTTMITEEHLHLLANDPGVPPQMIASVDERSFTVAVNDMSMKIQVPENLDLRANINIPLSNSVEVEE